MITDFGAVHIPCTALMLLKIVTYMKVLRNGNV